MNRLYAVESALSITGGNADHRLALKPSEIPAFLAALASKVFARTGTGGAVSTAVSSATMPEHDAWITALADDLCSAQNRGAGAILIGAQLPAWCHALAHAMHAAIGAVGATVSYIQQPDASRESGLARFKALVADMNAGRVSTLVVMGLNPAFTAPLGPRLRRRTRRSPRPSPSPRATDRHRLDLGAALAHFLRGVGRRASDGTISPSSP